MILAACLSAVCLAKARRRLSLLGRVWSNHYSHFWLYSQKKSGRFNLRGPQFFTPGLSLFTVWRKQHYLHQFSSSSNGNFISHALCLVTKAWFNLAYCCLQCQFFPLLAQNFLKIWYHQHTKAACSKVEALRFTSSLIYAQTLNVSHSWKSSLFCGFEINLESTRKALLYTLKAPFSSIQMKDKLVPKPLHL